VIHPEELASMDRHLDACDMVQIPVLPLPLPPACWTHGVYCDDFAEFHSKDLPVRQMLGGFIPGAGVGVGFSREALEKLAARSGRPFDPDCLTEDYETGFRIHGLGRRQLFLAPRVSEGRLLATRGVFPRDFTAAVRQRARWTIGIALQSWERHGWGRGAQGHFGQPALAGCEPAFSAASLFGRTELDSARAREPGRAAHVVRRPNLRLDLRAGRPAAVDLGKLDQRRGHGVRVVALRAGATAAGAAALDQDRAHVSGGRRSLGPVVHLTGGRRAGCSTGRIRPVGSRHKASATCNHIGYTSRGGDSRIPA